MRSCTDNLGPGCDDGVVRPACGHGPFRRVDSACCETGRVAHHTNAEIQWQDCGWLGVSSRTLFRRSSGNTELSPQIVGKQVVRWDIAQSRIEGRDESMEWRFAGRQINAAWGPLFSSD